MIHTAMGLGAWVISTLTDFNNIVAALAIVISGTVLWENRNDVSESLRARDSVYLPIIWWWLPVVLLSIPVLFAVLEWNMDAYRFHYDHPSLLTAFSSAFIHNSQNHLMDNLTGYIVVIPPSLAFALLAQNKRRWYITWWAFLIVVPLASSTVGLLNPPVEYESKAGFSSILAAHSSLLIISTISWIKYQAGKRRRLVDYHLLVVPLAMSIWYLYPTELFGVSLSILALLSIIGLTLRRINQEELIARLKSPAGLLLIVVLLVYLITIQNFMMPTESGVNIQGHYTGLVVGYAVSTLGFSIYTASNVGESWQIEIPVESERGRRLITTLQKKSSKATVISATVSFILSLLSFSSTEAAIGSVLFSGLTVIFALIAFNRIVYETASVTSAVTTTLTAETVTDSEEDDVD